MFSTWNYRKRTGWTHLTEIQILQQVDSGHWRYFFWWLVWWSEDHWFYVCQILAVRSTTRRQIKVAEGNLRLRLRYGLANSRIDRINPGHECKTWLGSCCQILGRMARIRHRKEWSYFCWLSLRAVQEKLRKNYCFGRHTSHRRVSESGACQCRKDVYHCRSLLLGLRQFCHVQNLPL